MSSRANRRGLREFDVLSHLSDAQLRKLSELVTPRSLAPGEPLFAAGDPPEQLFFVVRGHLKALRTTGYGDFELSSLSVGELVGELGLVDQQAHPDNIVASGDTDLLVLSSGTVERGDDRALELALYWAFWKSLSRKLRAANRKLSLFFGPETATGNQRHPKRHAAPGAAGSAKLDLAAKRGVFEEQQLSAMEINFLATLSREERFAPGQEIFHEGEPGDKMYVVVEGQVLISTVIPGAGEEALGFLDRGEFFGEMALIDGQPRSADARAHSSSGAVVLEISREVLEGLLDIEKVSSLRLLKVLCGLIASRLRAIDEKLTAWFVLAGGDISGGSSA